MEHDPNTLQEAIVFFSNPDNCLSYLIARRWPNGVVCPTCGSKEVGFVASRRVWQCKTRHEKSQFSIKVGTIFEDSPIGLDKWLTAMWMVANCRNGVSSYEIHRDLKVTQKSAWFMLHRIRLAMQNEDAPKLAGEVEVDETYIGGKARNMHRDKKDRVLQGKGGGKFHKFGVQGILRRDGEVRLHVLSPDQTGEGLRQNVRDSVEASSHVYSDELIAYIGLAAHFTHEAINHAEGYVRGNVHTNGLENFWSLLKRGINGTYVSIEPYHLFRYVDEQAFRFNTRIAETVKKLKDGREVEVQVPMKDGERMSILASQVAGKRLTHRQVTGKDCRTRTY